MRIGVFDSGVGGLSVAQRLRELFPQAEVLSADDRQKVPYGSRAALEVRRLTRLAVQPLLDADSDVIVLACNTATAAAIDQLRRDLPEVPFVGLEPMVKPAAAMTRSGAVVVCATPATVRSERYQRLKQRWAADVTVVEPDCVEWAAAVERGEQDTVDLVPLVRHVEAAGADVVVLACTHYHWLKQRIQGALGPQITVLEPSDAVAAQVARVISGSSRKPERD